MNLIHYSLALCCSLILCLNCLAQCESNWTQSDGARIGLTLGMDLDQQNNMYGIGVYTLPTNFGTYELNNADETPNLFFFKRDNTGDLQWVKTIEGDFLNLRPSVLILGNQLMVSATFTGSTQIGETTYTSQAGLYSLLIMAYDLDGNELWVKQFDNDFEGLAYASEMEVVDNGEALVFTGRFFAGLSELGGDFGMTSAGASVFLIKMTKDGEVLWGKKSSGNVSSRGWTLATDNEGNILLGGYTFGSIDFDANIFFIDQATFQISPFVAKFDADGNSLWIRGGWTPQFGSIYAVDTDAEGNVYVGGGFSDQTIIGVTEYAVSGINDAFLAKYTANGELQWLKTIGANQENFSEYITSLHIHNDTEILLTGHLIEGADFEGEYTLNVGLEPALRTFLASYDVNGNLLKATGTGGTGIQETYASKVQDGHWYIHGKYNGIAMLGNDTLYPYPEYPDSFATASFQWKLDLNNDFYPLEVDFEVTQDDASTYTFSSTGTGQGEQYTWNFGLGYEQAKGASVTQNFFEDDTLNVCLTVSNCLSRQTMCQEVIIQLSETALVPISFAALTDDEGFAQNLDTEFEIRGIVHSPNLNQNQLEFVLIDNTEGINVYRSFPVNGYFPQIGDSISVVGYVEQYLGLTRFFAQSIEVLDGFQDTQTPTIVDQLNESTESELVQLQCVSLVDTNEWTNDTLGFTVQLTNGTQEFEMRIDESTEVPLMERPAGSFNLTGLGSQESFVFPPLDGYFIVPRFMDDFQFSSALNPDFTVEMAATPGLIIFSANTSADIATYEWTLGDGTVQAGDLVSNQYNETGEYDVCLTVTDCSGQGYTACKNVMVDLGTGINEIALENYRIYPNPVQDNLYIEAQKGIQQIELINLQGSSILTQDVNGQKNINLNIQNLAHQLIFVRLTDLEGNTTTQRILIN